MSSLEEKLNTILTVIETHGAQLGLIEGLTAAVGKLSADLSGAGRDQQKGRGAAADSANNNSGGGGRGNKK